MFGNLSHLIPTQPRTQDRPPDNVPPPVPVHLPRCRPRPATTSAGSDGVSAGTSSSQLTTVLQALVRPAEQINIAHLELLGVQVNPDVALAELVPDPSCLPDFDKWDTLNREEAQVLNASPQPVLCNDKTSPGAAKYVDVRLGLLTDNGRAFRAVNRVSPRPGEPVVRLGYCHEFFCDLENISGYWDDTSLPRLSNTTDKKPLAVIGNPSNELGEDATQPFTPSTDAMEVCKQAVAENDETTKKVNHSEHHGYYRTMAGTSMPAQLRIKVLTSFLKLVTYDFSCSLMSRQGPEPRLQIRSPAGSSSASSPKHSHFSSRCNFLFRTPLDRDLAKRGVIDGPIAAVSPRHTTLFPPRGREREAVIDLAREVIAALITAQNRSREGKTEERIGKDAWWATTRRWGGGPGGPVGREEELVGLMKVPFPGPKPENKEKQLNIDGPQMASEKAPTAEPSSPQAARASSGRASASGSRLRGRSSSNGSAASESSTQPPNPKRPRTHLAEYDAYRMVRPPSMHWDPRTRYAAIGRQRGVDYDDVFVISSLFHHISIVRMRVPDLLLEVLSGAIPDPGVQVRGKLEMWRTRWFDFFIAQDRVDAMKAVWAIMAYSMRRMEAGEDGQKEKERQKEKEKRGKEKEKEMKAKETTAEATKGDEAKKDTPRR